MAGFMEWALGVFNRRVPTKTRLCLYKFLVSIPIVSDLLIVVLTKVLVETDGTGGAKTKIIAGPAKGMSIRFPQVARGGLVTHITGQYEPETVDFILAHCDQGSVVIDIGANIGYISMICSRLVGSTGRVYAFEPIPETFQVLISNIEDNRLDNVFPEQLAISDRVGSSRMEYDGAGDVAADFVMESVPLGYHPATATIQLNVPTTTLDAYVESQGLEAVNLVKIDVEGAELMVLRGMRHVLKSFRPLVIVELVGTQRIEEGQLLFEEMSYDLYCTNSLPIKGQRATNILAVPRDPVD